MTGFVLVELERFENVRSHVHALPVERRGLFAAEDGDGHFCTVNPHHGQRGNFGQRRGHFC